MPRKISEERTRKEMIDPQLEKAGWYLRDHSKVKIEIPVDGYDAEPWNGVSDYCLYRENGEVLAVVEAKKTAVDVRLAEAQLTYYVTEIEKHQSFRPFGFLANGLEIHFVDVGIAHKREVFGFFTREDLENLLYIRQNAKPLNSVEINNSIVDQKAVLPDVERIKLVRELLEIHKQIKHTSKSLINIDSLLNLFGSLALPFLGALLNILDIWKILFGVP